MSSWQMTRIGEAPAPVLSLEEARLHLRVNAAVTPMPPHPDDPLIRGFVATATGDIDGVDGWLGRALVTQQWRLTLDAFPGGDIKLPLPPLRSVEQITYIAPDGAAMTLPASAYRVLTWDSDPGRVEPAFGTTWPVVRRQAAAVSIEYTCGFGAPAEVPEPIRSYIRLRLGQLYENRELVAIGVIIAEIPHLVGNLDSFRRSVRPL
jgi:uncharacterized phiE125 gp8 family phage protein